MNFTKASSLAKHYRAIGQTTIFLDDDADDLPWDKVSQVEAGSGWRNGAPTGVRIVAVVDGMSYHWSADFEGHEANGKPASQFDRPVMRDVAMRLPEEARRQLGTILSEEVLPALTKHANEYRAYLNQQVDSQDAVRGLIAFCAGDAS